MSASFIPFFKFMPRIEASAIIRTEPYLGSFFSISAAFRAERRILNPYLAWYKFLSARKWPILGSSKGSGEFVAAVGAVFDVVRELAEVPTTFRTNSSRIIHFFLFRFTC
ncbi:MAG: hypothetical protein DRJ47_10320 [Thermoprotei archaeon]|nr:MAG: hypothetical protein DRJ47_10320 [Thermoprotei archaeon]